jgi:hypothetical protein
LTAGSILDQPEDSFDGKSANLVRWLADNGQRRHTE